MMFLLLLFITPSPYTEGGALFALGLMNGSMSSTSDENFLYFLHLFSDFTKSNQMESVPNQKIPYLYGLLMAIGMLLLLLN
jgi:hypothetical protein